ncbi:MAG TPA: VOC family protein [Nocardioides sp.]|nr:VOC family protein [Nocardioides sp.]
MSRIPGEPIWIELFTPDVAGATAFYSRLFGWTARDAGPEYGGYVTFERDGEQVAGCMRNDGGGVSAWNVYLESNDAADTVAMARANGGQVLVEAMQVGDLGHMAMVTDPAGAPVGIWQPLGMPGFAVRREVGAPAWFEVHSTDYDAVIPFYENAFGWTTHTVSDTPELRYTTLGRDEDARAGIMDATGHVDPPSRWLCYLQVDDVDATLARALELGASRLPDTGPHDTAYGRLAALADPSGITFQVIRPSRRA